MSKVGEYGGEGLKNGFVVQITNVPGQIDENSLKSVMNHFGRVESCKLILGERVSDPATAFVKYKSEDEFEKALKADGKLECGGCKLKISKWDGEALDNAETYKRKLTESSTCQDSCWFCLSNQNCQLHMISYVSKHCYVAMAKGALSDLHTLVVPVYHYPNLGLAPLDVQIDVKNAVDSLFDVCLKCGLGAIAFERFVPLSMKVAMHTQVQVVPVPMEKAFETFEFVDSSNLFNDATRINYESEDLGFHTITKNTNNNTSYFYLQAVGLEKDELRYSKCLWVFNRQTGGKIPTHFGREVALSVFNPKDLEKIKSVRKLMTERNLNPKIAAIDWHNCITEKEEEEKMSKNISQSLLQKVPSP